METSDRGRRRRQWVALILSGVLPGLGQLYLRSWGKGIAFLLATLVGFWVLGQMASMDDLLAGSVPSPGATLAVMLVLVAVVCWSLLDAWRAGGGPR